MNHVRNALAVASKELQIFFRDRGSLIVYFLMPLLFASFFGQIGRAVGTDGDEAPAISVPIVVVNLDDGVFGQRVSEALTQIEVLETEQLTTATEAERQVADGTVSAAVILPAGFSAAIAAHTPSQIEVVVDPVRPEAAGIVRGIVNQVVAETMVWGEVLYGIRAVIDDSGMLDNAPANLRQAAEAQALGVIMTTLNELRQQPLIAIRSEDLQGVETAPPFDPFSFNMPAFVTMFAFFLMGTISVGILTEKENGTFRRLLASPIHPGAIIAGKMLAYMLVVLLQAVILFSVARGIFGMSIGDDLVALIILTVALAFVATSLGMLLASLARSSKQADSLGVLIPLVLAGLGGCIAVGGLFFRDPSSPMYYISNLTPHAHALEGYLRLFIEQGTLVTILPQIGILLGMGVFFFLIAMLRLRFDS